MQLASHYDITINSSEKRLKDSVKDIIRNVLIDNGILKVRPVSIQPMVAPLSEAAIQLRLKELALQEKQLEATEKERQFKEKQMYIEHERFLKEFELKTASERSTLRGDAPLFDVGRHIKLVPPFSEKDVEKFERVATTSKWPKNVWTLLLQSVLIGKAHEAYSALSLERSTDYDEVKAAILKAYELVPEAYRQRF